MGICLGLALCSSLLQGAALASFGTGTLTIEGNANSVSAQHPIAAALSSKWGDDAWLLWFGAFLGLGLLAVAVDHIGKALRVRLVMDFEAHLETTTSNALDCCASGYMNRDTARHHRKTVRKQARSTRLLLFLLIDIAASGLVVIFPAAYLLAVAPSIGVYVPLTAGLSLLPTAWIIRRSESASLDEDESGGAERWGRHRRRRELSGQSAQSLSLVFTFGLLVWGVFQVRDGAMAWPHLLTVLLVARIVYGPLASIAEVAARASQAVPETLEFLRSRDTIDAALS